MSLSARDWGMVALFGALNAGIGFVVQAFRLPFYLDLVGSMVCAVVIGPVAGAVSAAIGSVLLAIVTVPIALAYIGTSTVVSFVAGLAGRYGFLHRLLPTIVGGLLLGLLAALLSAPVTTYAFGGVSLTGADTVTAFFRAMGNTIGTSVLYGGLATDPVDKLLASLAGLAIVRALPKRLFRAQ